MMEKFLTNGGKIFIGLGTLALIPQFIYDIDGGKRAVMFNRFGGVSDVVVGEGSHFYLPWFQNPVLYDITSRFREIKTTTGTKDLQTVSITLRVLFHPKPDALPIIHKTIGPDYDERIVPSITNEVLKSIVAQYDAESLLTNRDQVSKDISDSLHLRAAKFNLKIDDVAITQLSYGREFTRAIEEKQVAEQETERAKFIVERTEQEKLAAIIRAEGEAEAARIISESMKTHGRGMLAVRKLEAAKDIAETLSKSPNVNYVPSEGQQMIFQLPK